MSLFVVYHQESNAPKNQLRVVSGTRGKKPRKKEEPKPWGWKNQSGKQFKAQSMKDPFYDQKQEERRERVEARKQRLLKQVRWITVHSHFLLPDPECCYNCRERPLRITVYQGQTGLQKTTSPKVIVALLAAWLTTKYFRTKISSPHQN